MDDRDRDRDAGGQREEERRGARGGGRRENDGKHCRSCRKPHVEGREGRALESQLLTANNDINLHFRSMINNPNYAPCNIWDILTLKEIIW